MNTPKKGRAPLVSFRMPAELLAEIDLKVAQMKAIMPGMIVTRADVLRAAYIAWDQRPVPGEAEA